MDDISLDLPVGKRLAVVGASGAGKTTLVNLLVRYWEYEKGVILLGENDLRSYRAEDIRRNIGLAAQNAYLFNASIRDNLLVSRPDATEEELIGASKQAQIYDLIRSLPDGFDTWIGEWGLRLSGGERQRLIIARALLRDAPLLILDEPTANLDTLAEREILRVLTQGMEKRSTLLITHRLVGLEGMDEILVMQNGRVIERGRHADLVALGGIYRKMLDLQNQGLA